TSGTFSSIRYALVLSITTAPCSTAFGTSFLETEPPAEKKAISIFEKLSGVASSTVTSSFLNDIFFPADRFEDNSFKVAIGKFFSSKILKMVCPTAPVAPPTATLDVVCSYKWQTTSQP